MTKKSKFYTVLVIGEKPEESMKKFSKSLKVEPYIKYKYLDAEKMRKSSLKYFSEILKNSDKLMLNDFQKEMFKDRMKTIENMSSFEYYSMLTNGLYYDEDGNAMSDENPDGKWDSFNLGENFSYPFKLKNGGTSYSATFGEVDWDKMHMDESAVRYFETVWRMVMDKKEPANEEERKIKEEWETRTNYLNSFKDEDSFISHNCSFWSYAIIKDGKWYDLDEDKMTDLEWTASFFNRFLEDTDDDEKLTLFEFSRFEDRE